MIGKTTLIDLQAWRIIYQFQAKCESLQLNNSTGQGELRHGIAINNIKLTRDTFK